MTNRPLGCQWLSRGAITIVGGLGVLSFAAGSAAAQSCYPPGSASCSTSTTAAGGGEPVTVSDSTVAAGQTIQVTARGFAPGATVTFIVDGQVVGTAIADEQGVATTTIIIPPGTNPGQVTLTATGIGPDGQTRSVTQTLAVVNGTQPTGLTAGSNATGGTAAAGGASPGTLARTGAVVVPTAAIGVGLVAGGVLLRRSARKRNALSA